MSERLTKCGKLTELQFSSFFWRILPLKDTFVSSISQILIKINKAIFDKSKFNNEKKSKIKNIHIKKKALSRKSISIYCKWTFLASVYVSVRRVLVNTKN